MTDKCLVDYIFKFFLHHKPITVHLHAKVVQFVAQKHTAAFATERHQFLVPAGFTSNPQKAMPDLRGKKEENHSFQLIYEADVANAASTVCGKCSLKRLEMTSGKV